MSVEGLINYKNWTNTRNMDTQVKPSFMDLPDEVKIFIFSFLSAQDLVGPVRKTCIHWNNLTYARELWRRVVFTPSDGMTDLDVIKFLIGHPEVKNILFKRRRNYDKILNYIGNSFVDINSITIRNKQGPCLNTVMNMIRKFPKMQSFETALGFSNMWHDVVILFGAQYRPVRYTVINVTVNFPIIKMIIDRKKDFLQALALNCRITSKAFKMICTCSHLKYLSLYNDYEDSMYIDISPLYSLRELETLQLTRFPDVYKSPLPDFHGIKFSKLRRLEICEGGKMLESTINTFLALSPNLQHLNLHGNQLRDHQVQNISRCTHLEYVDVSYNFKLGDNFLSSLASGCHKLKSLDISNCKGVTDMFIFILHPCNQLETITLEGHDLVGDLFNYIPLVFPKLMEFHVKHFLYPYLLTTLKQALPLLDITRCPYNLDECILPH